MRAPRAAALMSLAVLAVACGDGPASPPIEGEGLARPWQSASPASQGFDAAQLGAAVAHARTLPQILSMVVARNGVLVAEEYFNGADADDLHDVRSVTKSVVSTLAGIAVRRGELSLDTRIADHLPAWSSEIDAVERTIDVEHLLTMSGGWTWDESGVAAYNDWVLSADPAAYLLRRAMSDAPGAVFRYNTAAVYLLGLVIESATGRSLQQYAQEHLFEPLGITRAAWETFPGGRANGGAGLDLRPRDLAKLGQLWLQSGDAGSAQIVDASWMQAGTQPAFPWWQAAPPLDRQSYGRLWWLSASPGPAAFFAWGHGGQFIWVVPTLDLVVVVTHDWRNASVSTSQLARNGLDLIVNHVVPSAR